MWLLASFAQTGMLLAGVVLLILILLRRTYRYYGSRHSQRRTANQHEKQTPRSANEVRSPSPTSSELLSLQVEMHEYARGVKAELDSKMRVLQLLIGQARHESERLEQVLARIEASGDAPADVPASSKQSSWLPGSADRQAEIFALADDNSTAAEIAEKVDVPVGEVELILSLRGVQQRR